MDGLTCLCGLYVAPLNGQQITVNLTGILPSELLLRVSDKGEGKTEEKLSGWGKLSTTKDPRA